MAYQRYGQRPGAAVGARALLWIVVSLVFLFLDVSRLLRFRAAGLAPGWFLWAQVVLWSCALLFWIFMGLRSLRKPGAGGKVS